VRRLWETATIDRKITVIEESNTNLYSGIREELRSAGSTPRLAGLQKMIGDQKSKLSDHLVFERVSQELSISRDVKRFHHSVFVKGDCARFYADHTRNLLHRQATREQL
jgi:hypothetical protein